MDQALSFVNIIIFFNTYKEIQTGKIICPRYPEPGLECEPRFDGFQYPVTSVSFGFVDPNMTTDNNFKNRPVVKKIQRKIDGIKVVAVTKYGRTRSISIEREKERESSCLA